MTNRLDHWPRRAPLVGWLGTFVLCLAIPAFALASGPKTDEVPGEPLPLWTISQAWDAEAEVEFSRWVEQLGQARGTRECLRFRSCLENPKANSLWTKGERWPRLFADCADLPYVLRGYFAYKTGRPFQFTNRIYGRRYGKTTRVKSYADFTDRRFSSVRSMFRHMTAWIHSGFFRTAPGLEGTDTYPVAVTRDHVRPGTIFYEPRGHVLVVVRVEGDGTIYMIDGHPDNSLTYKRFSSKIKRGGVRNGGGFRNWRWVRYRSDGDREGMFERESNADIVASGRGYDAHSQYQKTFLVDGHPSTYHGWVRAQLRLPVTVSAVLNTLTRWFDSAA